MSKLMKGVCHEDNHEHVHFIYDTLRLYTFTLTLHILKIRWLYLTSLTLRNVYKQTYIRWLYLPS